MIEIIFIINFQINNYQLFIFFFAIFPSNITCLKSTFLGLISFLDSDLFFESRSFISFQFLILNYINHVYDFYLRFILQWIFKSNAIKFITNLRL